MQLMRINTAIYLSPLFLRYGQETPQENLDTVFKFEIQLRNAKKEKNSRARVHHRLLSR